MGLESRPSYTETEHKHDWSANTGRAMASNLMTVAQALEANPIPPPQVKIPATAHPDYPGRRRRRIAPSMGRCEITG